jgi:hypothetical protein
MEVNDMVTVSQVQRGLVLFIDNEVASAFNGWQKAVVAGVGGLIASNIPALVKTYSSHPLVSAVGLYDCNSNLLNIDAAYNAIVPKLGPEKIPIDIPKIGTIKLGKEEFDALMRYIREV